MNIMVLIVGRHESEENELTGLGMKKPEKRLKSA